MDCIDVEFVCVQYGINRAKQDFFFGANTAIIEVEKGVMVLQINLSVVFLTI